MANFKIHVMTTKEIELEIEADDYQQARFDAVQECRSQGEVTMESTALLSVDGMEPDIYERSWG